MNMLALVAAQSCIAIAVASATLWMLGHLRRRPSRPVASLSSVPLAMRLAVGPARLFEPLMRVCLPRARLARLDRTLEAMELRPPFSAALWESMRAVHASVAALVIGLASDFHPGWTSVAALAAWLGADTWLRRCREQQLRQITRELPAFLDLMTVCVEAGATLTSGIRLIVSQAPDGPLRSYFERVLREIRGGRPRAQAFSHVAEVYAAESLTTLADALAHAESSGMSLGQVLRAQAAQRTAERFARAERLAMQAPVKMLGPLILCIFPCTFIVIGVPIAVRLMEAFSS